MKYTIIRWLLILVLGLIAAFIASKFIANLYSIVVTGVCISSLIYNAILQYAFRRNAKQSKLLLEKLKTLTDT